MFRSQNMILIKNKLILNTPTEKKSISHMSIDHNKKPVVLAFAGPNGSGKSTVSKIFPKVGVYVNADDLKKEYNISDMEAAKQAENIRGDLLIKKLPFSFETVLSTDRNLILLKKAKTDGYEVQCVYVLTCNPGINIARVRSRVKSGGHDVPDDKIIIRYYRALELLPKVISACDKIVVYDNSDKPALIFEKNYDVQKYYPNEFWNVHDLKKLLGL